MSEINNIINLVSEPSKDSFKDRISYLRNVKQMETSIIEDGVSKAENAIKRKIKSFVIYGEPQSGKTEVMIALTCKLVDLGFKTIFVVMNDNSELETQNFLRFQQSQQLNPSPRRDFELHQLEKSQLQQDKQRIIFCRKNSVNLQRLIENCRYMEKRIIIDDEADFASVDTKINKTGEASTINKWLQKLGKLDEDGYYIGVTATPGRLDLNNTFRNNANEWIYLDAHKKYVGRSFFFPMGDEKSEYNLQLLPDEGDHPKYLRASILRFLLRSTHLNFNNTDSEPKCFSMLIHTAGRMYDHLEDKKIVDKTIELLSDPNDKGYRLLESLVEEAKKLYPDNDYRQKIIPFILKNIERSQVVVINSKNDRANVERACKPNVLYTFAIGGNIVSRGLTFENLLSFFFSRSVKGKLQQNTYIQRARMFGTRPHVKDFELTIPHSLYENWADCFQDHELSVRLGKSGNLVHIERSTNRASDNASIDKNNIVIGRGEREIGEIFVLTEEFEQFLINAKGSVIDIIEEAYRRNFITEKHFAKEILEFIKETSKNLINDSTLVFLQPRGADKPEVQNIGNYKSDGIQETITRASGGIIQGMINKRDSYKNKIHYILPIKNNNNEARFLYRQSLGQTILQNISNKKNK